MHIVMTQPLFAWESLEDSPSLSTIQQLLVDPGRGVAGRAADASRPRPP
jgi:hypothetical protein